MTQATLLAGAVLGHLAQAADGPFRQAEFEAAIERGKWLLAKTPVREAVEAVAALKKAQREALRDAHINDVSFESHIDNPAFQFQLRDLDQDVRKAGIKLLTGFYKEILGGNGFSGLPNQRETLDRDAIETGYRAANPDAQRICPACLEDLPLPVAGRSAVDRDHYFPQSKYPSLSVHPLNIVPVCLVCNQRAHFDDHPITLGAGELRTAFLPYQRPGIDYVELRFRPGHKDTQVEFVLPTNNDVLAKQLHNFDRTYKLTERWSHALPCLHDALMELLFVSCQPISADSVKRALEYHALAAQRGARKNPRAFLMWKYTGWLLEKRVPQVVAELTSGMP